MYNFDFYNSDFVERLKFALTLLIKANKETFVSQISDIYKNYSDNYNLNYIVKNYTRIHPEEIANHLIDFFISDKTTIELFDKNFNFDYVYKSQNLSEQELNFFKNITKFDDNKLKKSGDGVRNFFNAVGEFLGLSREFLAGSEVTQKEEKKESKKIDMLVVIAIVTILGFAGYLIYKSK